MKQTPIRLLRLIFVSALVAHSFLPGLPASFADDQAAVSEDVSGEVEARTFHEDTAEAAETAALSGVESPGVQTNISPRQSTSSSDADSGKTPHMTYSPDDESDYDDGGITRTQVSGTYRLAAGVGRNRTFSVNDANSDLDDRDFHFLFGDRRENTYNPNIYSQYKLDIDSQINKSTSFYAQLVADPWSYVGHTNEIVVQDQANSDMLRFRLKYWGPNNSTVPVSFRTPNRGAVSFGDLQADSGYTTPTQVRSFDFGVFQAVWDIPAQEIDYEFRPLRKMWVDVEGDIWKLRVFGLADQNQVMTSDDPLNLSNHKDYWEHSKWLDQWMPVQVMRDNTQGTTILRGHYEDEEAFYAKDSSGNYLTLLRGAALEADFGRTYVGMMTASRFGLWDEYQTLDNVPGVIRVKHMVTPQWMLGSLYTYRIGLIDREPDSFNQVLSFDTKYYTNETDYMYAQAAGSLHEVDRLSEVQIAGEDIRRDYEGYAYKTGFVMNTNTSWFGESKIHGDFAWMDAKFKPELSKYTSTRDDELWGTQITFAEIPPDLEPYKIGTGLDRGRYVGRLSIESNNLSQGWTNEFDMRHVRRTDSNSFIEHVMRNEFTVNLTSGLTGKVFGRSHILPKTQSDVEPFLSSFIFAEDEDPALFGVVQLTNSDIDPGLDPSQNTWGLGLQYEIDHQWTVESSWSHTNEVHDFPRGLQNGLALNSPYPDPEFPSVLLDRTIPFLYGQHVYGLPPYDYYSIVKERLIYQPADKLQFIFHAAQNSNRLWGPVDENFNHQGISVDYQINDRWSMFFDYTHSRQVNVDRLINTNYREFNIVDHHNIYGILKYKINPSSVLTMEYGVFGDNLYNNEGSLALPASQYAVTTFSLPTLDTEHLFRIRLEGEF